MTSNYLGQPYLRLIYGKAFHVFRSLGCVDSSFKNKFCLFTVVPYVPGFLFGCSAVDIVPEYLCTHSTQLRCVSSARSALMRAALQHYSRVWVVGPSLLRCRYFSRYHHCSEVLAYCIPSMVFEFTCDESFADGSCFGEYLSLLDYYILVGV